MGMFDYIRIKLPLEPLPLPYHDGWFQTKDFDRALDHYEIREDGTLWCQDYDVEDRSDPTKEGLESVVGCMTRVNERWVPVPDYFGRVIFYGDYGPSVYTEFSAGWGTGWVEFEADIVDGKVHRPIKLLEHRVPAPVDPVEQARLKEKFRNDIFGEGPIIVNPTGIDPE